MRVVKKYMFIEFIDKSSSFYHPEPHEFYQPLGVGPYEDEDRTLATGAWSSIEEAEDALVTFVNRHGNDSGRLSKLVLVPVYRIVP